MATNKLQSYETNPDPDDYQYGPGSMSYHK